MCNKCFYTVIDGTPVHVNGDLDKMGSEEKEALAQIVKVAKNYMLMRKLEDESNKKVNSDK